MSSKPPPKHSPLPQRRSEPVRPKPDTTKVVKKSLDPPKETRVKK